MIIGVIFFPKANDELSRGKKSIETYGLYRIELAKYRHEHLIRVFSCLARIQNLIFTIDRLIEVYMDNVDLKDQLDTIFKKLKKNLEQDLSELKGYIQNKSKYAGMSRQYINEFLNKIGITL